MIPSVLLRKGRLDGYLEARKGQKGELCVISCFKKIKIVRIHNLALSFFVGLGIDLINS